jgi:hypothetical protein
LPPPGSALFAGFDAAVDQLYRVIGERAEAGPRPMRTIGELAERIAAGVNRSTNVERILLQTRAGGNAVLCGLAFRALGGAVTVAANLGKPPDPVFAPLAASCRTYSLGQPNRTDALEFTDGKILLTDSRPLEAMAHGTLAEELPPGGLGELWRGQDAVALMNWTMMPGGTELFLEILRRDLPETSPRTVFFFDTSDPARRSDGEICRLLDLLAAFAGERTTFLSVNAKEMERMASLLGKSPDGREEALRALHGRWPLEWLLHRYDGADSFGREGWATAEGFFTPTPTLSTGGGDTFNGGFLFGHCGGLDRSRALFLGNALAGSYVRLGRLPSRGELGAFLAGRDSQSAEAGPALRTG